MSIIEPPYDADIFDFSAPGGEAYVRGQIIEAGVREGYSIGSVRNALAGYGVGFTSGQVSSIYNALSENIAAGQTATALNIDASTGEILGGTPPENWTGQYVHQVTATFRSVSMAGDYELRTRTLGIVSDNPLTSLQAQDQAMSIIESPIDEEDEDKYGSAGDLLSMSLSGTWYRTMPSILSSRNI
jgi:hypothetical protein